MNVIRWPSTIAALLLSGSVAIAHHSFAMFDLEKDLMLQGVVKELQYTNPHVWIQVVAADGKGGETEWSIEGGAPGMMTRAGWKSSTLKPGDKVTLTIHPLKNGNPSGSLVRITVPDGRTLGSGGGPPPPPKTAAPST